MPPGPTAPQIKAVKAFTVYNSDGGRQAVLRQSNSLTSVDFRRTKLWHRPAKQLKIALRSAATLTKTNPTAETYRIPEALQKYVAHFTLQGRTQPVQVYILGASHVSRQSCTQATELISTVKPEIVLLELCKDRVDLLVDPSMPSPQHWHSRGISFHSNFPQQSSFTATACKKLLSQLKCQPGRSFAACDIEQDCIQLLASGMFATVVPETRPASFADAPMFVYNSSQVHTVAPLGSLRFQAAPRQLPQVKSIRVSSSIQSSGSIEQVLDTALEKCQQGTATSDALLEAHQQLQDIVSGHTSICFSGVESGDIEVSIVSVKGPHEVSITGLEGTAKSGKGWGISAFQPRSPQVPSLHSNTISTTSSSTERDNTEANKAAHAQGQHYTAADIEAAKASTSGRSNDSPSGLSNTFTNFVTQTYARYQRGAGEVVGVASGEAWRVAFQAAAQHGVSQVHLGDKPAIAMSQRMSAAIWNGTAPYLGAALLLSLATTASATTHVLPSDLLPLAAIITLGLLGKGLFSVLGPLLEIQKLSKMSAKDIEAAVDLREPLQNGSSQLVKLWGEDALLDWPGALDPVIHERDAHMARTIFAAAQGTGGSPAFIADNTATEAVWQYMMPKEPVDSDACPKGHGSGLYFGLDNTQSIVAVVGTAHVRGIVAELEKLSGLQSA